MKNTFRTVTRTRGKVAHLGFGAIALVLGVLAVGCSSGSAAAIGEGPGSKIVSDIIACKAEADCETGETCGQGYCQMKRCTDKYDSIAPLGQTGYAYTDRALVVSAASSSLDVYSAYAKGGSVIKAAAAAVDIAGGNFTGSRPEGVAVLTGTSDVLVVTDGKSTKLGAGFVGTHIAAGDTDGDGTDEIVVSGAGQYAICSAVTAQCVGGTVGGTPDDVALGDLNGDGVDEILFIGNNTLTIVDLVAKAVSTQPITAPLGHITAGDLDGDGTAEVIGTEAGGVFTADRLHVYSMLAGNLAEAAVLKMDMTVNNGALDLVYTKQDDKALVAVLTNSSTLRTYTYANGAIAQASTAATKTGGAVRIAASDVNGRSASVKLKGAPTVVSGPVVPLAVLTFPPYSASHSAGGSSVSLGTGEDNGKGQGSSESHGQTVSLGVGAGISASVLTLGANFGVNVSNSMGRSWARSKGSGSTLSVGASYSMDAHPETRGYQSGGVVLAGACFHKYDYTVEDPAGVLAAKDATFSTFVPVGGETTLWSTSRYNALSDAVADGRLPKVTITPKMGDVASYPTTPTTLDGKPIPDADNVFPKSPLKRAADVGNVGFSLTTSQSETNGAASSFSMGQSLSFSEGAHGGFKLFGIGVDVSVNASQGFDESTSLDRSYNVTVGTSTTFGGNIQSVPDVPSTPEDESALYGYSFRPYVYRHHYKTNDGTEGAFFAMTYTVGE